MFIQCSLQSGPGVYYRVRKTTYYRTHKLVRKTQNTRFKRHISHSVTYKSLRIISVIFLRSSCSNSQLFMIDQEAWIHTQGRSSIACRTAIPTFTSNFLRSTNSARFSWLVFRFGGWVCNHIVEMCLWTHMRACR